MFDDPTAVSRMMAPAKVLEASMPFSFSPRLGASAYEKNLMSYFGMFSRD